MVQLNVPAGISSWPGKIPQNANPLILMQKYDSIMKGIKDILVSRGVRGFLGLARIFRILDTDHDGYINFYEFRKCKTTHCSFLDRASS